MTISRQSMRSRTSRRYACPACGVALAADAKWCPACHFTGADSMAMYPDAPPPLLPVLDAAGIWTPANVRKIETSRENLRRRFPQFHFHICTVMMPAGMTLPVFGFWLLNVCPLQVNETAEDRAWTVLLMINARTGQAAVVPGYRAEPWLSDDDSGKALAAMDSAWKAGKSTDAVLLFFKAIGTILDQSWKRHGIRRSRKSRS